MSDQTMDLLGQAFCWKLLANALKLDPEKMTSDDVAECYIAGGFAMGSIIAELGPEDYSEQDLTAASIKAIEATAATIRDGHSKKPAESD